MQKIKIVTLLIALSIISYAKEITIIECPNYKVIDIDELKKERLISPHNQGSEFYFKLKDRTKKVFIEEEPRTSKISKDLMTLVKLGTTMINLPQSLSFIPKSSNFKSKKECIYYKQSFKRASVGLATIDDNNNSTIYNFKVGKMEHLYLTADMPITNIKELSYDKNSNSFHETEQPASFYVGLNYKIGDIFLDYPISKFYNNLSLKGLMKFSNKPTKSIGMGIGYNLSKGVEIFIAKIWTDNKNISTENIGRTKTIVYGISFNLSRALEWVQ